MAVSEDERDVCPCLACYEFDADNIDESVRAIETSLEFVTLFIADLVDRYAAYAAIYEECGEVVRRWFLSCFVTAISLRHRLEFLVQFHA